MGLRGPIVAILALVLAGCAANDSETTGAIPSGMVNQPLTKGPAPGRKPAKRPAPVKPVQQEARAEAFDPATLVGLDKSQTVARLGRPTSVRSKPPATVWRYAGTRCAMEVFFYMDLQSQSFRALAYEVITPKPGEKARKACLAEINARSAR